MESNLVGYSKFVFSPFFRWWWSLVTGVASVLSFIITPPSGVTLSRGAASFLTLIAFALFFLTLSVLVQGWELFQAMHARPLVVSFEKCHDFGGDFVFSIRGHLPATKGMLLAVNRCIGEIEAPFALIELVSQTKQGSFQAKPLIIAPVHLRDYHQHKFSVSDMVVYPFVDADRIRASIDAFRSL